MLLTFVDVIIVVVIALLSLVCPSVRRTIDLLPVFFLGSGTRILMATISRRPVGANISNFLWWINLVPCEGILYSYWLPLRRRLPYEANKTLVSGSHTSSVSPDGRPVKSDVPGSVSLCVLMSALLFGLRRRLVLFSAILGFCHIWTGCCVSLCIAGLDCSKYLFVVHW